MVMIHGGDELDRRLTELADQGALKTWYPQIKWLTERKERRARTVDHFSDTSRDPVRLLRTWLAHDPRAFDDYSPDRANVQRIQSLYTREHRHSRVPWLKKHLADGGNGTRIEVWAADEIVRQSGGKIARLQLITVYGDEWATIVDHWDNGDRPRLYEDWEAIADRLYPPGAYVFVDHLGF